MFSSKITQRVAIGLGSLVAGMAVSTSILAGAAGAQPIGPDGPEHKDGQCAVVHQDDQGNEWVEYVPKGTRDGQLGYCGADGEWHAGLLIDERSNDTVGGDTGGPTKSPVVVKSGPQSSTRS